MRKVLTIGTFDTPHVGHASFLRKCSQLGDLLVVGINSDEFVKRYKGAAPLFSFAERYDLLMNLGYECRMNDGPGRDLIFAEGPDVLAIATDWARKDYYKQIEVSQDELDQLDIVLAYVPYTPGISTSELKRRLA